MTLRSRYNAFYPTSDIEEDETYMLVLVIRLQQRYVACAIDNTESSSLDAIVEQVFHCLLARLV